MTRTKVLDLTLNPNSLYFEILPARIDDSQAPSGRAFSSPPALKLHENCRHWRTIANITLYNMAPLNHVKVSMRVKISLLHFTDHSQKRKLNSGDANKQSTETVDTSRPSAVFTPTKGRKHTLSLALPGSIIAK